MGFQFELPETWLAYTNEEIAHWVYLTEDITQELQGNTSTDEDRPYMQASDFFHVRRRATSPVSLIDAVDMRARNFFAFGHIGIHAQELSTFTVLPITELEYLQILDEEAMELDDFFQDAHISLLPRQIGDISWYYMIRNTLDGQVHANFVSIQDNFLCSITISLIGDLQDIEDIWEQFTEIDPQFLNVEGVIPAMSEIPSLVHHGVWDGHVYINPSLNLKLTVPDYFDITANRGLARAWGLSEALYSEGLINSELWIEAIRTGNIIPVMHTFNRGEASIVLFVRRKPLGMREFPLEKQLRRYIEENEVSWIERGAEVQVYATPRTVEIAGHQWITARVVMPTPGFISMADTFLTIVDDHVWLLQTESNSEYELQKILSMFSQLTTNP